MSNKSYLSFFTISGTGIYVTVPGPGILDKGVVIQAVHKSLVELGKIFLDGITGRFQQLTTENNLVTS